MLLYFYEAMILILASSFTGSLIGMGVGYTMCLQESLILDMDLEVFFPYRQFIVITALTFICALMATVGPSYSIVRRDIAMIFRG